MSQTASRPPVRRGFSRLVPRPLRRFWKVAWESNMTGLASMLAFNLLYGIIPIALLALFIAGHVLASQSIENSVLRDLRDIFPNAAEGTLNSLLKNIRDSTTGTGVLALGGALWLGSSFWGSLDTAFARIYGCQSRPWLKQKRFAFGMLFVVLLFMVATVLVPVAQSIVRNGAHHLPFDLKHVAVVIYIGTLALGLGILFGCLVLIYYRVPNFRVPWRAVWPGALGATIAIGVVDYGFPVYLEHFNTLSHFGTTVVFIVVVLLWFYVLALIILSGGIVNALRMRPPQPGD